MVDYTTIIFGILFGLSSSRVEQSLVDLESPTFLVRQKASEYLKNDGIPYLFRYIVEGSKPSTLEKCKRMESIIRVVQNKWIDELGTYYDREWQLEGDYADLLFGPNWPRIDYFVQERVFDDGYWVEKRTNNPPSTPGRYPMVWHSHRVKCGCKELLEENFDYSYSGFVDKNYRFGGPNWFRCYKYALEMEHTRDPYLKAATKILVIDELKKGANPFTLGIILAEVRRREFLATNLCSLNTRTCVRFYLGWEHYTIPFLTIHGRNQFEVPDQFPDDRLKFNKGAIR